MYQTDYGDTYLMTSDNSCTIELSSATLSKLSKLRHESVRTVGEHVGDGEGFINRKGESMEQIL